MAKKKETAAKKAKKTESIHKTDWQKYISLAAFVFLLVLIFYPPFFRGLFFKEEMFLYHLFSGILLTLVIILKIREKDYLLLKNPLDLAVLAYALAYLIAMIGAVHPGEAFYGFLRALNYLVIYLAVIYIVKSLKEQELVLKVMFAAGTAVALIGILAASGYSGYPGAFDGRSINSTLQYANATAAYLATTTVIGLALFLLAENRLKRLIYTLSIFLMVFVVLATYSKGAWLIFLIGVAVLFIGVPGLTAKLKIAFIFILAFAASFISYNQFAVFTASKASGFSYLYPGLLFTLAGYLVLEALVFVKNKIGTKKALILALAVVILAGGAGGTLFGDKIAGEIALNENLACEIQRFTDFSDNSYTSRADFYRWAWEIVKDYPVNGTGAGGWNALYHQYQDYLIWTTEVHNHFMQVWVEAGTIGILAFVSMWILLLIASCRILKGRLEKRERIVLWGILSTAAALGLHALIDFDLSLGALSIILWTLFALISAQAEEKIVFNFKIENKWGVLQISLASLAALLLVVCGSSYYAAFKYAAQGSQNLREMAKAADKKEQNAYYQEALKYYEKAEALNSLSAEYKTDLAYAYALRYLALKEANHPLAGQALNQTVDMIRKAARLKPYDPKIRELLLNTAGLTQDFDIIKEQAEALLKVNPLDVNVYETNIKVLAAGMELYQKNGDQEKARKLVEEMIDTYDLYLAKKQEVNTRRGYWDGPRFNLKGQSLVEVAKACFIKGEYKKAEEILKPFATNLLQTEFSDTDFRLTGHEDEKWKLKAVKKEGSLDGYALRIEAKQDLGGWPNVLHLASAIPVYENAEYILEVRYRVEKYVPNPDGDTEPYLGIWGSISGKSGSKNTSFAFYRYTPENNWTGWQAAKQGLKIEPGYDSRYLYIGTGSIGKGTVYYIDYIRLYPVLQKGTPPEVLEPYVYYAASLYRTGSREEAEALAGQIKAANPEMYKRYEELIKRKP